MTDAAGVQAHELRVGDAVVGRLRLRGRGGDPSPALLRIVTTLIASEVERLRAPERASEAAQEAFLRAVLHRQVTDRGDIVAPRRRARRRRSQDGAAVDRRARAPLRAGRGRLARARARRRRARRARRRAGLDRRDRRAAARDRRARCSCSRPAPRRPARAAPPRPSRASCRPRCTASRSPSATRAWRSTRPTSTAPATRRCSPPTSPSAGRRRRRRPSAAVLAFEATGAYRLLLPAMSEDPGELQRFYAETVEPLVAYDEQYETDLVQTLETFLECDGNVANTAQRLFTHRHTIRYRLERVARPLRARRLLDDGREKLGLGLKAMRVLGIAAPRGPATERGARGGRVPRGGQSADRAIDLQSASHYLERMAADVPTLYEWAGGAPALHRLTEAFYARVRADEVLAPVFARDARRPPGARRDLARRGLRRPAALHRGARRLPAHAGQAPRPRADRGAAASAGCSSSARPPTRPGCPTIPSSAPPSSPTSSGARGSRSRTPSPAPRPPPEAPVPRWGWGEAPPYVP